MDTLLLGGLSVLLFAVLGLGYGSGEAPTLLLLSVTLQWWVNWPHFSATCHRLYRRRENVSSFPFTAVVVPLLVLFGISMSLASPTVVAPTWIKLFMIWSPYHFSAQTLGITLLYARRTGWSISPAQRFGLACFIFGTYFFSTLKAETSLQNLSYYGIQYPGLGLPEWTPWIAQTVMWFGLGLFLVKSGRRLVSIPWILLVPAFAQYIWFVGGGNVPAFYYFVPLFHSLQYLLIAWAIHLRERLDEQSGSWRYVGIESLRWFALNFIGGAALFWAFPRIVKGFGVELAFATGVVIAGVQIHHFIVDGVIWKLRNPRVANPLMVTLGDLVKAPPQKRREAA